MDIISFVITIVDKAKEVMDWCEKVQQCQPEALRLGFRVENMALTLEEAAGTFRDNAHLGKRLVELHSFLGTLPPLLERCTRPANLAGKVKYLARASALVKAVQDAETQLQTLCDDLGLAMLPSIGKKLNLVGDNVEAGISATLKAALQEHEVEMEKMMTRLLDAAQRSGDESSRARKAGRFRGEIRWDLLEQSKKVLGEGSFGAVYSGTYCGRDVAIKRAVQGRLPGYMEKELR